MEPLEEMIVAARQGVPDAVDRLFRSAYADLREIAHRRLRRSGAITTLDTTVLVHECYLRLNKLSALKSEDRAFLLNYAARAMRSIVVDLMRQRSAARHGGELHQVTLEPDLAAKPAGAEDDLLRINDALEELGTLDPRLVQVVEMKYFAGMNFDQIAACLGIAARTVRRDWQKARLLLHAALENR
jgi:RNA polymerase sigma factor (TIGR02999 family)